MAPQAYSTIYKHLIFIAPCAIIDSMTDNTEIIAFTYTVKVPHSQVLNSANVLDAAFREAERLVLNLRSPVVAYRKSMSDVECNINGDYIVKIFYERA